MLSPMKLNQGPNYTSTSSYQTTCGMKLQLLDKGNSCLDLFEEEGERTIVVPANSISAVVFVNWSKMDLKRYDITSIENIPEVVKYAPPLKRTRGEPLSLYACLDAFLREEPLVPEDMWLVLVSFLPDFCISERNQLNKAIIRILQRKVTLL
jgi:hypothetical protein